MAEVSSCVATVKIGDKVQKGQQLGYFMFGGSSHAVIFEKKANVVFKEFNRLYKVN
jgi:phosphatidylserine decarboxylase